jgi:hypothetical protein
MDSTGSDDFTGEFLNFHKTGQSHKTCPRPYSSMGYIPKPQRNTAYLTTNKEPKM